MTSSAELQKTFEDVAASMRRNAAQIEATARSQGIDVEFFRVTLSSLETQAAQADAAAEALRNGDAVSIDEL